MNRDILNSDLNFSMCALGLVVKRTATKKKKLLCGFSYYLKSFEKSCLFSFKLLLQLFLEHYSCFFLQLHQLNGRLAAFKGKQIQSCSYSSRVLIKTNSNVHRFEYTQKIWETLDKQFKDTSRFFWSSQKAAKFSTTMGIGRAEAEE